MGPGEEKLELEASEIAPRSASSASDVRNTLAEYLATLEAGGEEGFDTCVARHADVADELRELYSRWLDASRLIEQLELKRTSAGEGARTSRESEVKAPSPLSVKKRRGAPLKGVEPTDYGRLREGMVLGDFCLVRQIGSGGMGQVWEADQISLSRPVALKTMLPGLVDERSLDLFERESLGEMRAANLADQAAARGGAPWSTSISTWPEFDDGHVVHAPAGSTAANAFGIHEVHGNLFEWCLDGFQQHSYHVSPVQDPITEPRGAQFHAVRGGCFSGTYMDARCATRANGDPTAADDSLGVRPARSIAR